MLTLKHYELLVVLAEELHFGRAAQRLGISQPQLTHQLKQMEEIVGTLLFNRNRRRVELTRAGNLLLPEASGVMRHAKRAEAVALQAGHGLLGELRLGYIGAVTLNGVLTRLLTKFRTRAIKIQLQLLLMDLDQQFPEVKAGNLDAGLVRLPYPALSPDLATRTLYHENLWIALPRDHPMAEQEDVELAALGGEDFIATHLPASAGFSAAVHTACTEAGITPNVVYRAPQFTAIASLVEAGLGVAVVPEALGRVRLPGVVYRPLRDITVRAEIALVYRQDNRSPPLDLLLDCIEDAEPAG
ncbi:LysR substrate-binding domain-containing protein [Xanthobacter sp. TB0136]|uniref:LysR substrate-binding domain-containing protein n=1 Tax=Xanthobacter sp. TB0136 TaxID=3459177 RepID=UPI004039D7E5